MPTCPIRIQLFLLELARAELDHHAINLAARLLEINYESRARA